MGTHRLFHLSLKFAYLEKENLVNSSVNFYCLAPKLCFQEQASMPILVKT